MIIAYLDLLIVRLSHGCLDWRGLLVSKLILHLLVRIKIRKLSWVLIINCGVTCSCSSSVFSIFLRIDAYIVFVFSVWFWNWYNLIFPLSHSYCWRVLVLDILTAICHRIINQEAWVLRTLLFLKALDSSLLLSILFSTIECSSSTMAC